MCAKKPIADLLTCLLFELAFVGRTEGSEHAMHVEDIPRLLVPCQIDQHVAALLESSAIKWKKKSMRIEVNEVGADEFCRIHSRARLSE